MAEGRENLAVINGQICLAAGLSKQMPQVSLVTFASPRDADGSVSRPRPATAIGGATAASPPTQGEGASGGAGVKAEVVATLPPSRRALDSVSYAAGGAVDTGGRS